VTFYQGTNSRVALLLPGRQYSTDRPLLYYSRAVLVAHGWSVEEVWWTPEDLLSELAVQKRIAYELEKVADQDPLVVGKSLGTLALPLVAQRGWPAIWLTPLLDRPELVLALKAVTGKTLLVGGTADEVWVSSVANASGLQVLEMQGADHGLEIPGDPLASVGLLHELLSTMNSFVESL
jgi:hypothetical protein